MLDNLLLATAFAAWLIGVGSHLYADGFVTDARHLLAIMSPRTFSAVALLWVGWWLAVVVLFVCVFTIALSHKSRALSLAAFVSAAYAVPLLLFGLFAHYISGSQYAL